MQPIHSILILFVALLHYYFMILEMFYWTKPKGLKTFGLTKEKANDSKVLAANQGLYNGFLATGLVWSVVDVNYGKELALFFLFCISIAGLYGAYSTNKIKLFYIQSVPAMIAIVLLLFI